MAHPEAPHLRGGALVNGEHGTIGGSGLITAPIVNRGIVRGDATADEGQSLGISATSIVNEATIKAWREERLVIDDTAIANEPGAEILAESAPVHLHAGARVAGGPQHRVRIRPGRILLIASCPADVTGDGQLDVFDVWASLALFNAGCA